MALEMITVGGLACFVTAAIAVILIRVFGSSTSVTLVAGLAVPTLGTLWGLYDLFYALEVDSPPPGALLFGGVVVLALLTPCTLLISFLTARVYKRRH